MQLLTELRWHCIRKEHCDAAAGVGITHAKSERAVRRKYVITKLLYPASTTQNAIYDTVKLLHATGKVIISSTIAC